MIDRAIPEPSGYLDRAERNEIEMLDHGRVHRENRLLK